MRIHGFASTAALVLLASTLSLANEHGSSKQPEKPAEKAAPEKDKHGQADAKHEEAGKAAPEKIDKPTANILDVVKKVQEAQKTASQKNSPEKKASEKSSSEVRRPSTAVSSRSRIVVKTNSSLPGPVTEMIMQMIRANIPGDIIVQRVKATQPSGELSAQQLIALKRAGVSDHVLRALARPSAPPVPAVAVVAQAPAPLFAYTPAPPQTEVVPPPPPKRPPIEARVAYTVDSSVTINAGKLKGVAVGDYFEIANVVGDIIDPQTREVLDVATRTIGRMEIVEVRERVARGLYTGNVAVKIGDIATRIPRSVQTSAERQSLEPRPNPTRLCEINECGVAEALP